MLNSIISAGITLPTFFACILCAVALGLGTAAVFTFKARSTSSLMLAIAILPAAIALMIMMVNGNIGAGVAVAGAFALVRFRSVPGNAREIAAIFVAMALGLACGMGLVGLAVLFFVVIAVLVIVLQMVGFGQSSGRDRLLKVTVPENLEYDGMFDDLFEKYLESVELERVRTTNMGTLYELSWRVRVKDDSTTKEFLDAMRCRNGNLTVSLGRVADSSAL